MATNIDDNMETDDKTTKLTEVINKLLDVNEKYERHSKNNRKAVLKHYYKIRDDPEFKKKRTEQHRRRMMKKKQEAEKKKQEEEKTSNKKINILDILNKLGDKKVQFLRLYKNILTEKTTQESREIITNLIDNILNDVLNDGFITDEEYKELKTAMEFKVDFLTPF